jgi:hypothetical protein
MPSALWEKSRIMCASNPNPMKVTKQGAVQTSRQLRNFVFCRDCEQLFSKLAENYVMTQVFESKSNTFPLLDPLRRRQPGLRAFAT